MLAPKRQKFRKQFRGVWRNIAIKGNNLVFGNYGLKSFGQGWLTDRQIEACRGVLARSTRKAGKFWIRVFPDKPYSKKPPEVTMGAGKGDVSHYVSVLVPGRIIFEFDLPTPQEAKDTARVLSSKLAVKTKFVSKKHE